MRSGCRTKRTPSRSCFRRCKPTLISSLMTRRSGVGSRTRNGVVGPGKAGGLGGVEVCLSGCCERARVVRTSPSSRPTRKGRGNGGGLGSSCYSTAHSYGGRRPARYGRPAPGRTLGLGDPANFHGKLADLTTDLLNWMDRTDEQKRVAFDDFLQAAREEPGGLCGSPIGSSGAQTSTGCLTASTTRIPIVGLICCERGFCWLVVSMSRAQYKGASSC